MGLPYFIIVAFVVAIIPSYFGFICSKETARYGIENVKNDLSNAPLYINELYCGRTFPEHSSDSASMLCRYYLSRGEYAAAYRNALRSLEMIPDHPLGISCLASIYYELKKYHRASFYAELLYRKYPLHNEFAVKNVHQHLYLHLNEVLPSMLYPIATNNQNSPNKIQDLLDGSMSTLSAYERLQMELPLYLRGVAIIVSREGFLHLVENILAGANIGQIDTIYDPAGYDDKLCVKWPLHKKLRVYYFHLLAGTFGETIVGLSDALNRLRIAHTITSHITSDEDPDTILIKATGAPLYADAPKPSEVIFWNFEKGPKLAVDGEPTGFLRDSCGREEASIDSRYFESYFMFWDSIPSNMLKWNNSQDHLTHKSKLQREPIFMPSFVAENVLRMAHTNLLFQGMHIVYVLCSLIPPHLRSIMPNITML
jgi:hypothetical protein